MHPCSNTLNVFLLLDIMVCWEIRRESTGHKTQLLLLPSEMAIEILRTASICNLQ